MSNLKDELVGAYNKVVDKKDSLLQEYLKNFKNGTADALLMEERADEKPDGYEEGYFFGQTMYRRLFVRDK